MTNDNTATVYLLHFSEPLYHARHYMGTASNVDVRMRQHGLAHGAKLMIAVRRAGITWVVARTWQGGRELERALKLRHNGPKLCPICRANEIAEKMWRGKESR